MEYLKSLGHKAPKSAVSDYLEWFEDAYFLFTAGIFDASLARRKTNPKKIYCIDHAMITSLASGILVNSGHLLENLVFTALRRVSPEVYYYKTKGGLEVDFIVSLPASSPAAQAGIRNPSRLLVQFCESMDEPQTRKREVTALSEAMTELDLKASTIVTRSEKEEIKVDAKKIEVVTVWRFLLNLAEPQL